MESTTRDRVAGNVRASLGRARQTQAVLAAHLGISQQALSRRLTGEIAFDVDELDAIARYFSVPLAELYGDSTAVSA